MPKHKPKLQEIVEVAREYAKKNLDRRLLEHTRGCAETARKLAHRFTLEEEKAVVASYLHDIAKSFPKDRQVELARELGMSEAEIDSYPLPVLHGPLAALMAKDRLGIEDPEILQAIAAHSTGCTGMCEIGKAVFIADYIEQTRSFPGASELRSHGSLTLNEIAAAILRRKLDYLLDEDKVVDPRAIEFWNELMDKHHE
jgi:predicted HD superfamily hydrolase involved in NAD metabolism